MLLFQKCYMFLIGGELPMLPEAGYIPVKPSAWAKQEEMPVVTWFWPHGGSRGEGKNSFVAVGKPSHRLPYLGAEGDASYRVPVILENLFFGKRTRKYYMHTLY